MNTSRQGRALAIFLFGLLLLLGMLLPFSPAAVEEENRPPAAFPSLSLSGLLSGNYCAGVEAWASDRLPLRRQLVRLHAEGQRLLGKRQNRGVLFCRDGSLVQREDYPAAARLQSNLRAIEKLHARLDAQSIPFVFLAAPRAIDRRADALPLCCSSPGSEVASAALATLPAECLLTPDAALDALPQGGYFMTDHHWTLEGAAEASELLLRRLGVLGEGNPFCSWKGEVLRTDFRGSALRRAAIAHPGEALMLPVFADPEPLLLTDGEGKARPLYDLQATDGYSTYLGGNAPLLYLTGEGEGRPRLLLIRDSFAASAAPFLAQYCDLTLVDPRLWHGSLSSLIKDEQPTHVVLLAEVALLWREKGLSAFMLS